MDDLLQSHFLAQLQWVKIKKDWVLLRKGTNFPYRTSIWHLIACKYPKFSVLQRLSCIFFWHLNGTLLSATFDNQHWQTFLWRLHIWMVKGCIHVSKVYNFLVPLMMSDFSLILIVRPFIFFIALSYYLMTSNCRMWHWDNMSVTKKATKNCKPISRSSPPLIWVPYCCCSDKRLSD